MRRFRHTRSWSTILFVLAAAGVGLLRAAYCFSVPLYTTDLLRHLGYGKAFHQWGFGVYDLTPPDLSPWPCQFLWSHHHYTYPAVTLLFDAGVTMISTSTAFAKCVLTLLDALGAWLVFRAARDRWTALLYWINPLSIWYVSREGQYEALAGFCMVLALHESRREKPWAPGLLSLAVQTKLFPVFLLPYFLTRLSWRNPKRLGLECAWGAAGWLPSLAAVLFSGYLIHLFEPGYIPQVNPISWRLGDPAQFNTYPYWLPVAHFGASLVFLALCLLGMEKQQRVVEFLVPAAFLVFVKLNVIGQFWYVTLLPAFCLPVKDTKWRRWLFTACLLFGGRELYSIFIGPIGYQNPPDVMSLLEIAMGGF
ncbi:MAG: glycosyltransferase family 87 protein [bacterium]